MTTPKPTSAPKQASVSTPTPIQIKVYINGEEVVFDRPPELVNDRFLVPIRPVVENLACTVVWDVGTQTSYINASGVEPIYAAQKSDGINVYVTNERITFPDQQPLNLHGYIYTPARYVVEKLNCTAEWDAGTHSLFIVQKN